LGKKVREGGEMGLGEREECPDGRRRAESGFVWPHWPGKGRAGVMAGSKVSNGQVGTELWA
jgi:hypothetical protein